MELVASMRIRKPFAGAFALLVLVAGYLGLAPPSFELPQYRQSDKVLHFLTFFLLTGTFYWSLDTTRRRAVQLTALGVTCILGIGSEVVQGLLPNDRDFDIFDIVANSVGSLAALALSSWYHQRIVERKRAAKGFAGAAGDDEEAALPNPDDMELEEEFGGQETGRIDRSGGGGDGQVDIDDELDHWDENAGDEWDDESVADGHGADGKDAKASTTVAASTTAAQQGSRALDEEADSSVGKKRTD